MRIAASNFVPGGVLEGFFNTFDPNTPFDSTSPLITLTLATPNNLDQDFSYYGSGSGGTQPASQISSLIWLDTDADGLYEPTAGETPLGGVTVDLYRDLDSDGLLDHGEPRIATTTTANTINAGQFGADGTYIFPGLPVSDYLVDVSDRAGVLSGYWHSHGTAGTNNHSQADPYAVTIAQGAENLTADFGYYIQPAAVGNYIWLDTNANGLQNNGEIGINGVRVTLVIIYPDGTVTALSTLTGPDPVAGTPGWYAFGNLLLDEDHNGDGVGAEPSFSIVVDAVEGLAPTTADVGSDDTIDSDAHTGVMAQPIQGQTNTLRANDAAAIASYDFGFVEPGAIGNYIWADEDSDGFKTPANRASQMCGSS